MSGKLSQEIKSVQTAYLVARVNAEMAAEALIDYRPAHNISREDYQRMVDSDTLPADHKQVSENHRVALRLQTLARNDLIEVAEKVTGILAKKNGMPFEHLSGLFAHLRKNPYSPPSKKALDAFLRLTI